MRTVIAFLLLCGPALAGWNPFVDAALPDHVGDPVVAVKPCDCGDDCDCGACGCLACPHVKPALPDAGDSKVGRLVLLSQPWCAACPAAKRAARESKVAVEIVEGDEATRLLRLAGGTVYPSWVVLRGDRVTNLWYGQSNAGGVEIMRRVADDASYTPTQRPVETSQGAGGAPSHRGVQDARASSSPGWHEHQCPCGNRWSHDVNAIGSSYAAWRQAHTCRRCGRLVTAHAD